jgi:hypothetical protein
MKPVPTHSPLGILASILTVVNNSSSAIEVTSIAFSRYRKHRRLIRVPQKLTQELISKLFKLLFPVFLYGVS